MQFKKNVLTAAFVALMAGGHVYAQDTGWGDVAGGTASDAWGSTAEDSAGGWGAPAAEAAETAPAQAQSEPGKAACGADDPRYAQLVPVLKSLQAGESIEPMQTSFRTYVSLSPNVRSILADNIYISSADCSEQYLFEGELTGKINVDFTDLWQVINDAIRTDDLGLMQFVTKNTRAAPEPAMAVISMVQNVPLDDAQVRKLYSVIAPERTKPSEIRTPLMLEIYLAFGGLLNQEERGKVAIVGTHNQYVTDIYLTRNEGRFEPRDARFQGASSLVPSLLQSAGFTAQGIPNGRARQAAAE